MKKSIRIIPPLLFLAAWVRLGFFLDAHQAELGKWNDWLFLPFIILAFAAAVCFIEAIADKNTSR